MRIQTVSVKPPVHWEEFERHANTIHHGKTKVWNSGGLEPPGCEALQRAARWVDDEAVVWWGDATSPPEQQGIRALGTPPRHPDFIRHFLGKKSDAQSCLFERTPSVGELQTALLLLVHCAAAKPNFLLRIVSPTFTSAYAAQCDTVKRCRWRLTGESEPNQPRRGWQNKAVGVLDNKFFTEEWPTPSRQESPDQVPDKAPCSPFRSLPSPRTVSLGSTPRLSACSSCALHFPLPLSARQCGHPLAALDGRKLEFLPMVCLFTEVHNW